MGKDKVRRVSYSQYLSYTTCPFKYALRYIHRKEPELLPGDQVEIINLIFGTAMHNTVQEWIEYRFNDFNKSIHYDFSSILLEQMQTEFKNNIVLLEGGHKIYPTSKESLMEYYADGVQILNHVYDHADEFFPLEGHKLVGIEIPVNKKIKGILEFIGFLDVVLYDDVNEVYKIIDLKTSTSGWNDWAKSDTSKTYQLLLYKAFYADLFDVEPKQIVPEFIILKRKITEDSPWKIKRLSRFTPSHGKISMKRALDSWNEFVDACFDDDGYRIEDREYVALPSPSNCKFCEYRLDKKLCPVSFDTDQEN